ncbi:MAG TPA: hypothetical protein VGA61_21620 [Anaerolineae bacterium]
MIVGKGGLLSRAGVALVLWLLLVLPVSAQGGEHRAALVVRFGDGTVQTRCVAFSQPSISGQQLLARSGLPIIVNPNGSFGGAVCSISGSGCNYPSQDCFCRCMGTQCEYWAYYHWIDAAASGSGQSGWQYSQVGAAAYQVKDGAIEGWSWGPGNFTAGTEPPKVALADVCKAAAVTASPAAGPGSANLLQYAEFGVALVLLLLGVRLVSRRRPTRV